MDSTATRTPYALPDGYAGRQAAEGDRDEQRAGCCSKSLNSSGRSCSDGHHLTAADAHGCPMWDPLGETPVVSRSFGSAFEAGTVDGIAQGAKSVRPLALPAELCSLLATQPYRALSADELHKLAAWRHQPHGSHLSLRALCNSREAGANLSGYDTATITDTMLSTLSLALRAESSCSIVAPEDACSIAVFTGASTHEAPLLSQRGERVWLLDSATPTASTCADVPLAAGQAEAGRQAATDTLLAAAASSSDSVADSAAAAHEVSVVCCDQPSIREESPVAGASSCALAGADSSSDRGLVKAPSPACVANASLPPGPASTDAGETGACESSPAASSSAWDSSGVLTLTCPPDQARHVSIAAFEHELRMSGGGTVDAALLTLKYESCPLHMLTSEVPLTHSAPSPQSAPASFAAARGSGADQIASGADGRCLKFGTPEEGSCAEVPPAYNTPQDAVHSYVDDMSWMPPLAPIKTRCPRPTSTAHSPPHRFLASLCPEVRPTPAHLPTKRPAPSELESCDTMFSPRAPAWQHDGRLTAASTEQSPLATTPLKAASLLEFGPPPSVARARMAAGRIERRDRAQSASRALAKVASLRRLRQRIILLDHALESRAPEKLADLSPVSEGSAETSCELRVLRPQVTLMACFCGGRRAARARHETSERGLPDCQRSTRRGGR